MKKILINAYAFNLKYAHELVLDVEEELMCVSPAKGLENHPAFTLGHLISGSALTSKYLGGPYDLNPEWEKLFRRKGPGDPTKPEKDSTKYPNKKSLLSELIRQHEMVEGLIKNMEEDKFNEKSTWRFEKHFPTLGDLLYFMCVTHEAMHLSQLAAWRRAMGLPSALAKL